MTKLNARCDRAQLVVFAYRNGLAVEYRSNRGVAARVGDPTPTSSVDVGATLVSHPAICSASSLTYTSIAV